MCARLPFTLLTDNSAAGEFYANGNLIGTDTSSPYSFSWTNVAAGTYTLSAIATDAQGASTTSAVRTIVVDAPPTISLVADPATAVAPATIVLTASANDADGTITKVEFFQGAALIATVNAPGPYTFTVNIAGAGIYSFSARATDNTGLTATSAEATVTVTVGAGGGAATIYYIYTDQLNTPRAITNEAATTVWKWDNVDPFGANAPNEDPDGDANNFVFNLRFPGQYFDRETNTHYNYYRDYDPAQGRYVESDPVGLEGGINTYAYVNSNPLSFSDPKGLDAPAKGSPFYNPNYNPNTSNAPKQPSDVDPNPPAPSTSCVIVTTCVGAAIGTTYFGGFPLGTLIGGALGAGIGAGTGICLPAPRPNTDPLRNNR